LGFDPSFLQNKTKHHANFFAKKVSMLHFGFWSQEAKKKSQKAFTHPMKILAFCISSFQSSWHFTFCIPWETKHNLNVDLRK
jgi:hypothetical protein